MHILGIDIGGSGIKGSLVDCEQGTLQGERARLATPQPATPAAVVATVAQVAQSFNWHGPIGCGVPAVVKQGTTYTAANIDPTWIGTNVQQLIEQATDCPVSMINDADAAGLAEMRFGAGKDRAGVVLLVTLGTGIGSALFIDGQLLPNTELGHIEMRGREAEYRAAESVRERKKLTWVAWAKRVDEYLLMMERLFWPDLIIVGGGVSRKYAKFFPYLTLKTEIVPAELRNDAGIIGAALAAERAALPAPKASEA